MKLAYQASTPDVRIAPAVTAYQADMETAFRRLKEVGYDGVELMVANPGLIDIDQVRRLSEQYDLEIPMICTGEVFGQDQVFFSHPDDTVRAEAIRRVKAAIDVAAAVGGQINVGRVRGGLVPGQSPETSRQRAFDGLREVCEYGAPKKVIVALEPVNYLMINFINTTQDGIAVIDELGLDNLKLMIDTNHMHIDDRDIGQSIRDARAVLSYVHLTDTNRRYPGHLKFDFAGFIKDLESVGYDGYVSVEVFQYPDQDTALVESYRHIKPLL